MKIGIQLPEVEREVRWPEYLAMARAAEEAGFESVWLGDHPDRRRDHRRERRARRAGRGYAFEGGATVVLTVSRTCPSQ